MNINVQRLLAALIRSAAHINYTDLPGNAELDLQLPLGGALQARSTGGHNTRFCQPGRANPNGQLRLTG